MKYYIYYLKKKGMNAKGKINYPKLRREIYVELGVGDEEKIVELLNEIVEIVRGEIPPVKTNRVECKGCSYFEFCWS
ncbi:protein of unknown function DUF83 [Candidatus Kryptonium thompsonii]|uniref:Dna2/Cas4 domain-containing protein n=1 Tax=Candidatus Kryptonium thompsonii TaxID=1633631 RepID=UPI0007078E07|nr:Dna2/Cas4 domain-containing protein [Candidatus Kryptonium thompsoni]CUS90481.1 protein of unknown function DUF83 [Candidatus Kryptonium thompsoni]